MRRAIHVAVLDDDPLYALGVNSVLSEAAGFKFAAFGTCIAEIAGLPSDRVPDVILVDARLADLVDTVRGVYLSYPSVKVLMLADPAVTVSEDSVAHVAVIAWLRKNLTGAELARAVQAAYLGRSLMDAGLEQRLIAVNGMTIEDAFRIGATAISAREFHVMSFVCRGLTNKEVAAQIGLSEHTVRLHTTSFRKKLGIPNRLAAAIAFKRAYDRPC